MVVETAVRGRRQGAWPARVASWSSITPPAHGARTVLSRAVVLLAVRNRGERPLDDGKLARATAEQALQEVITGAMCNVDTRCDGLQGNHATPVKRGEQAPRT